MAGIMAPIYDFMGWWALIGLLLSIQYARQIGMIVDLMAGVMKYETDALDESPLRILGATLYSLAMIFAWPIMAPRLDGLR